MPTVSFRTRGFRGAAATRSSLVSPQLHSLSPKRSGDGRQQCSPAGGSVISLPLKNQDPC
jgi:hypothetical protein